MYLDEDEEDLFFRNIMAKVGFGRVAGRIARYLEERRVYRPKYVPEWLVKKAIMDEFVERFID